MDRELLLFRPKVILLFGRPAVNTFYKHYLDEKVDNLEDCYLNPRTYKGATVFSLPHPTSMVRGKSEVYSDTFLEVQKLLR